MVDALDFESLSQDCLWPAHINACYVCTLGEGGGFKSPLHFHCVLHAKRGSIWHVKLCTY